MAEPGVVGNSPATARLSKWTVQRLWAAYGIAPHRVHGFKLSNDLEFDGKHCDVLRLT
jgi:hypothetical protein